MSFTDICILNTQCTYNVTVSVKLYYTFGGAKYTQYNNIICTE